MTIHKATPTLELAGADVAGRVFGRLNPDGGRVGRLISVRGELLTLTSRPLSGRANAVNGSARKRAIDITLSMIGLVLLAPLFIMIAIAIKLDTQGPVFFKQERYGVGRSRFKIFKFRSMSTMESNGAFQQAARDDARITSVGKILRRTSIDELPQLINVLRGEMSLVGPRPHAIPMDDEFGATMPRYVDRHLVRPGLTGLAQISGYRGPTNGKEDIEGRLRLDRCYVRTWSCGADVEILLKTPLSLLAKGIY